MSTEDNKAIVRRFFEEVFNRQNLAVLDELVSSDFIHGQPGRVLRGAEFFNEVKSGVHFLAFPDLHITIEDMIAEGDKVVTRWTARGTHQGEAMGLPPTGNEVTWTGMNFMRVVNGKLAEDWEELDVLGLMQQLGGTIPPGQSGD